MWGAASHAVMAVAQQRGWPFGSHGALRTAVRQLADETGDRALRSEFAAAEKFHANFYHDFMEHDADFDFTKDVVREFVTRIIGLMDASPNGSTG